MAVFSEGQIDGLRQALILDRVRRVKMRKPNITLGVVTLMRRRSLRPLGVESAPRHPSARPLKCGQDGWDHWHTGGPWSLGCGVALLRLALESLPYSLLRFSR